MAEAFFRQVYRIVAQIPFGKVASYGQIAELAGRPGATRAVGFAMRTCPEDLPWQRVVHADGSIAGGLESELRRALLEDEEVRFTTNGRVDMNTNRWNPDDAVGFDRGEAHQTLNTLRSFRKSLHAGMTLQESQESQREGLRQ